MVKVLLLNQKEIPRYRVPVYNYLCNFLNKNSYALTIVSGGIQHGAVDCVKFPYYETPMSFRRIASLIIKENPRIIIFWTNFSNLYFFPTLLLSKFLKKKVIYWGHGSDLYRSNGLLLKNLAYNIAFWLSDAIIIYAEHLKKRIKRRFHNKIFIANNTLYFSNYGKRQVNKEACLLKYGITTRKNIICIGRMQKRKRLDVLFLAFQLIKRQDIGLILLGPDEEGILREVQDPNIFKIAPIYGEERLDLLTSAEVFCLPGAIGLSIVDALFCGLPIVTEEGEISPEIMYFRDGINGFKVPRNDIKQLADKLLFLLDNDSIREEFSERARQELSKSGHIDRMCEGFLNALRSVS